MSDNVIGILKKALTENNTKTIIESWEMMIAEDRIVLSEFLKAFCEDDVVGLSEKIMLLNEYIGNDILFLFYEETKDIKISVNGKNYDPIGAARSCDGNPDFSRDFLNEIVKHNEEFAIDYINQMGLYSPLMAKGVMDFYENHYQHTPIIDRKHAEEHDTKGSEETIESLVGRVRAITDLFLSMGDLRDLVYKERARSLASFRKTLTENKVGDKDTINKIILSENERMSERLRIL